MPNYKTKHLGSRIWTLFSQLVAMFREVVEFLQGGVWYSYLLWIKRLSPESYVWGSKVHKTYKTQEAQKTTKLMRTAWELCA